MNKIHYKTDVIRKHLGRHTIATIIELKAVLNTTVDMTIFRKLNELGYHSSYSHRGKYYTLQEIVTFDQEGVWSFNNVYFSRYGTLQETVYAYVNKASAGYSADELTNILQVEVKKTLLHIFRQDRLFREKCEGNYIYYGRESTLQKHQRSNRFFHEEADDAENLEEALIVFLSTLNERQRRLFAGFESLRLGYGGDKKIAALFGLDAHTIARGRKELLEDDVESLCIRKSGGGRHPLEKKTPE